MMEEKEKTNKKKDPIWKHAKIGTPKYKSPDELWNDALRYFQWCDDNPVDAPISVVRYQKEKKGGSKEMKKQDQQENVSRPYTIFGLCAFTGISSWYHFKNTYMDKEGFRDVILTIENVITSQQIDGALTGVFKENLTARLNNIAEKQQTSLEADLNVNGEHTFTGFAFLPWTEGIQNSEQSKISAGEVIKELPMPEKEKIIDYAEIIDNDDIPDNKHKAERGI